MDNFLILIHFSSMIPSDSINIQIMMFYLFNFSLNIHYFDLLPLKYVKFIDMFIKNELNSDNLIFLFRNLIILLTIYYR